MTLLCPSLRGVLLSPASRLLALGLALGAVLHAAWPVFEERLWCHSQAARLYECLVVLIEAQVPRWGSVGVALAGLAGWGALSAWAVRAARHRLPAASG